jgi:hypothetical protein
MGMEEYVYKDRLPSTREERTAKKEKARWDAEENLTARKKADDAFHLNFERLKAERLAREAAEKK